MIGLLLLKHICGLSDEGVCERSIHDPYFQYFTGEEFFQHAFPHERSDLSHWRKWLGDRLELLLAESLRGGARHSNNSWQRPLLDAQVARNSSKRAGGRLSRGSITPTHGWLLPRLHPGPGQVRDARLTPA